MSETASRKKALIFGVTGQDGSYLAEFLLKKGYEVHSMIRRASTFNTSRIDHLYKDPHHPDARFFIHHGDLMDGGIVRDLVSRIEPDEIYNLAAQSHVQISFLMPEYTADVVAMGTLRVLEAIRSQERNGGKKIRFYQASSSEMFGSVPPPQGEATPFHPRSPYASAKVFGFDMTRNYREAYGMFAANGILFNHESPRRGETFLTKKVTRGIAMIMAGLEEKIYLGNLSARRDWGYAPEYVEAMWMMLQAEEPDDFVIGTGVSHSVETFIKTAFGTIGIGDWERYIGIDERYKRPAEVDDLVADASKAKKILGWEPKVKFEDLVRIMMKYDLEVFGKKDLADAIVVPPEAIPEIIMKHATHR